MHTGMNIWLAIAGATAVTYAPRGLGVLLSGRLNTDGPLFRWVSAVAYALLAALIARLIVLPLGPLQATTLTDRLASTGLALPGNLMLGVATGGVALALMTMGGFG